MRVFLGVAVLFLLFANLARADEIEIGYGVVCGTQKEVEQIFALIDADMQTAIRTVNAEANDPAACGFANVAFVRRPNPVTVESKHGAFQIVEIVVVGVVTESGMRGIAPIVRFSLFRVAEASA